MKTTDAIIQKISKAIRGTEFEGKVYLAGGYVRDKILGRPTQDIDLTVELPDGGIRLAEFLYQQKISFKPLIYKQFGTALVTIDKHKIELVMTRRENYRRHDRKPDVVYGSLLEDVLRRDLTVNALLKNISNGKILDLSGKGLAHLQDGIIRATSDPDVIFQEDPLRLLRAIRFATELRFEIERKTLSKIRRHASELQYISRERIADETLKIIGSQNFLIGLDLIYRTGLKPFALPMLRRSVILSKLPSSIPVPDDIAVVKDGLNKLSLTGKLTLILWQTPDSVNLMKLLKLSKQDMNRVLHVLESCKTIRRKYNNGSLVSPDQYRLAAYGIGPYLKDFATLYPLTGAIFGRQNCNYQTDLKVVQKLQEAAAEIHSLTFPLTGEDLIAIFNVEKGSVINLLSSEAHYYWLQHPEADKTELVKHLKSYFTKKMEYIEK